MITRINRIKNVISNLKLKRRIANELKRAKKHSLPATLTVEEWLEVLAHFGGKCYITGESTNIQLEHNIPLAWNKGGTYQGNSIPMCGRLNLSKSDKNAFTWFYDGLAKGLFTEAQHKNFDKGQLYLAKLNGFKTLEEYRNYYDRLDPQKQPRKY